MKLSIQSGAKTLIFVRQAATKSAKSDLSSGWVKTRPNDFYGLVTNFGWFVVPKPYYAYRWTTRLLDQEIKKAYPDIQKNSRSRDDLQSVIDKWVQCVNQHDVPSVSKPTKADLERQKNDDLYRQQLKEVEVVDGPASETKRKVRYKRTSRGSVTFIHAWNYFFSVTHPRFAHLGKTEARKEVTAIWNSMTTDEKEAYRESYAKLLEEGKDVFRGKIVLKEEKIKRSPKSRKYSSKEKQTLEDNALE
ncbi:Piso0_000799 [Millerozyma farinosa CBS 7064]|uniref:Piso0_000799 protein n=1 Tax=Pichia sorbitophila (strain ATCC MYA-4447 / BCRC 22081 / CBS 7064 / NBRC 10061 / NRRL Y-12695) TaxID=559304 RepID=G8YRJ5_PICSO|nr:Piso0_000799 [Millerozyma farinosa CBS 7064]